MLEASHYESLENSEVRCCLCHHRCVIAEGKRGVCSARENRKGKLFSLVRNRLVAANVDPVEKKPLFHFLPGTMSMSIATAGCNFRCSFCQNHSISQLGRGDVPGVEVEPSKVVGAALESGCRSISYTYTEPVVFFETAFETGVTARSKGLRNIFVTNGYITKEAARDTKEFLDAANVDLKSFSDDTYGKFCGARLNGVLEGMDNLLEAGVWVEITTLVIPGLNDSDEELGAIAKHIASRSKDIPWHVSRFHPDHRMLDRPTTPVDSLDRARRAGEAAGLVFIYTGNIAGKGENTICPKCGKMVIERLGFSVLSVALDGGRCEACGNELPGCFG
ncbi:MAG TPA: AmmeMemoRadiSam system radical SAM enzyme [Acidobacteriota bacterium]|nr:AmmeMemoRadiSam system radical SAM enzyme [Acidobacteriota bacterium]HNT17922.1 AmmeMemoRadiSam system radical SAM enzyme [Acidobacteriota bacterium]HQO18888.1 AmmeMemoRadiSam system radical SAM enzyme [Acidobacteriota bacterium]HQQ46751.1 AmmeMemoRadiSam system radical SAM enzyme [Acidobacteriota bacterium]